LIRIRKGENKINVEELLIEETQMEMRNLVHTRVMNTVAKIHLWGNSRVAFFSRSETTISDLSTSTETRVFI